MHAALMVGAFSICGRHRFPHSLETCRLSRYWLWCMGHGWRTLGLPRQHLPVLVHIEQRNAADEDEEAHAIGDAEALAQENDRRHNCRHRQL